MQLKQKKELFSAKRSFFVSGHLCIMVAAGLSVITLVTVVLSVSYAKMFLPSNLPLNLLWKHSAFQNIAFLVSVLMFIYVGTIIEGYQLYGRMIILDDRIVFKAFLRCSRVFLFNEIKYIGIGSAPNGLKWIYFSKVPIPPEKELNFYRVNMSNQTMYLPYREEVVKSLKYYLPNSLSRAFR